MNSEMLRPLFQGYIEKFEMIRQRKNDKWRIAQMWQDTFNLNAEDLSGMLSEVLQGAGSLIDTDVVQPLYALAAYAKEEPGTVRQMFYDLFKEDEGDLETRQRRITSFIAESEKLRAKYFPSAWPYENDQRAVMSYLFLNDPDHHYLYKATSVREFADHVGFPDKIAFKDELNIASLYRLCDELVAAIKKCEPLLKANERRFKNPTGPMYPDSEFHILAFDIITAAQEYGLYIENGDTQEDGRAHKQQRRNVGRALELHREYECCEEASLRLQRTKEHLAAIIKPGTSVTHNVYGQGTVVGLDGGFLSVAFSNQTWKKFDLCLCLTSGFLTFDIPELAKYISDNRDILKAAAQIPIRLERAARMFQPYVDYLE